MRRSFFALAAAVGDGAFGVGAELGHFGDERAVFAATGELGDEFGADHVVAEADAVGFADGGDVFAGEAGAAHADEVDAAEAVAVGEDAEGGDVHGGGGVAGDEGHSTDAAELVE